MSDTAIIINKDFFEKNMPYLSENSLSIFVVLLHLQSSEVLTRNESEEINAKTTSMERFASLYTTISKKLGSTKTLPSLMDALKQTGNEHIAEFIEKNSQESSGAAKEGEPEVSGAAKEGEPEVSGAAARNVVTFNGGSGNTFGGQITNAGQVFNN